MEIIKFEVNNNRSDKNSNYLILEPGSFIVKGENNKLYFNENRLNIIVQKKDNQIKNHYKEIIFMPFDEGKSFYITLSELETISNLSEFYNLLINNLSDLNEEEIAQLDKELMEFSIKNLIDHALDTNDKELFMELTK